MQAIASRFDHLKKKILAQGERDAQFQAYIRTIVPPSFLKEATLAKNRIVLTASHKAAAQELFLQRERICEEFKKREEYQSHTLVIR